MNIPSHTNFRSTLCGGCGLLFATVLSPAAVTYSGIVDIPIPATAAGVYMDLDTGGTPSPGSYTDPGGLPSYTIGYSEPATWDVNLFFGGIGIAYSPTVQPFVDDTVGNRSRILRVEENTGISSEAGARTLGFGGQDFGGSGRSNGSAGESHFDIPIVDANPLYSAFTPEQQGYIAFVLNPGAGEQYGWMSVTLTNNGTPGTIHEWAYSDEASFQVGQVPEPGSLILLLVGSVGLLQRRRT